MNEWMREWKWNNQNEIEWVSEWVGGRVTFLSPFPRTRITQFGVDNFILEISLLKAENTTGACVFSNNLRLDEKRGTVLISAISLNTHTHTNKAQSHSAQNNTFLCYRFIVVLFIMREMRGECTERKREQEDWGVAQQWVLSMMWILWTHIRSQSLLHPLWMREEVKREEWDLVRMSHRWCTSWARELSIGARW
jgi:hypothetical protein